MAPSERGRAAGATPDDNNDDATQDRPREPPPPRTVDLGNGECWTIGTAADFRAAAEWLRRAYPEHSADSPTRSEEPVIYNMGIGLIGEVLDGYHGPHVKKLWLLAFAENANDKTRQGWPGRNLLASRADVSPSRASNLATELSEDGVIKRVGGGGRYRGQAVYELLPLAVDGDQGSARANPDNPSQGSARANPKPEVKGSESTYQGSESGDQGSVVSPLPAETPYNRQEPSTNATVTLSLGVQAADGGADDERETDSDFDEDEDEESPDFKLLAEAVPGADPLDVEDAITTLEYRKFHGEIGNVRPYLRKVIANGDAWSIVNDAAAERRRNKIAVDQYDREQASWFAPPAAAGRVVVGEVVGQGAADVRPAGVPETRTSAPPAEMPMPGTPAWRTVTCPVCDAGPDQFCRKPGTLDRSAPHAERHQAAAAAGERAAL